MRWEDGARGLTRGAGYLQYERGVLRQVCGLSRIFGPSEAVSEGASTVRLRESIKVRFRMRTDHDGEDEREVEG